MMAEAGTAPRTPDYVVFDVGGVLIDWNPRYLYRKLFDDDAAMEQFMAEVGLHDWNLELDRGTKFEDGVRDLAARHPHRRALIEAFHHRWHEMVSGPIDDTVRLLHGLADRGTPLYGITNFNQHRFAEVRQRFDFFALIDGFIVSGEVRLIKPDPAIYHALFDRYGLEPAAGLFIDDSPANVAGAQAVGLPAIRFTTPAALERHFFDCRLFDPT